MVSVSLITVLSRGGIAVIPTDTLYGIVACAENPAAVRRLYSLRRKTLNKPFIVLLPNIRALRAFDIVITVAQKKFLNTVWPGKVSVILSCPSPRFAYLHRGTRTVAFRVPRGRALQRILHTVGPLAAPSANPSGERPAETIAQARKYFGNTVDSYASARRRLSGVPSTIVSLVGDAPRIVRQGAVRFSR